MVKMLELRKWKGFQWEKLFPFLFIFSVKSFREIHCDLTLNKYYLEYVWYYMNLLIHVEPRKQIFCCNSRCCKACQSSDQILVVEIKVCENWQNNLNRWINVQWLRWTTAWSRYSKGSRSVEPLYSFYKFTMIHCDFDKHTVYLYYLIFRSKTSLCHYYYTQSGVFSSLELCGAGTNKHLECSSINLDHPSFLIF